MTSPATNVEAPFEQAKEQYAEWGVDVEDALKRLSSVAISLHCWQGDDVVGFEGTGQAIGGGLAVTGNYPGRARTPDELRADLDRTLSLLPGRHRLNLHASYAEVGHKKIERDALEPEHFRGWIDWAKSRRIGMDFNPTYFAHPLAARPERQLESCLFCPRGQASAGGNDPPCQPNPDRLRRPPRRGRRSSGPPPARRT